MKRQYAALAIVILLFLTIAVHAEAPPKIVMEEFTIQAVDPGIGLYVRNKHPQVLKKFPGEKILLFVHGSTTPPRPLLT